MSNFEARLKKLTEQLQTDPPDRQPMIVRFIRDIHKIYGDPDQPPVIISQDEFDQVTRDSIKRIYGGTR